MRIAEENGKAPVPVTCVPVTCACPTSYALDGPDVIPGRGR